MQSFFPPMLMQSQREPFTRENWIHEPKLDGMRCLALIEKKSVRLYSRNGRLISESFPAILKALSTMPDCVLDGEIICHDEHGNVSFEKLNSRWLITEPRAVARADARSPAIFYAFDLICLKNKSLFLRPLIERKALLSKHLKQSNHVQYVHHFDDGIALFESARELKLEG